MLPDIHTTYDVKKGVYSAEYILTETTMYVIGIREPCLFVLLIMLWQGIYIYLSKSTSI